MVKNNLRYQIKNLKDYKKNKKKFSSIINIINPTMFFFGLPEISQE